LSGDSKNDSHTNCNNNPGNPNGATSRHLQIIYISLKEKYSKDDDDEDEGEGEGDEEEEEEDNGHEDSEDVELGQRLSAKNNQKKCKKSISILSTEAESQGEYFELMECIRERPDEEDLGLQFR